MIERWQTPLFVVIAGCGLLIAVMSFLPWVRFTGLPPEGFATVPTTAFDLRGTETSRWRDIDSANADNIKEEDGWCSCRVDIGDGYFTALTGVLLIAAAGIALFAGRVNPAASVAVVAAVVAFALAGFNAIADWQALYWTTDVNLEAVEGDVRPALIVAVVAAAVAAISSMLAWSFERALELADEDEWEDTDSDEIAEENGETGAGQSA